jgi:hypothetical protein
MNYLHIHILYIHCTHLQWVRDPCEMGLAPIVSVCTMCIQGMCIQISFSFMELGSSQIICLNLREFD